MQCETTYKEKKIKKIIFLTQNPSQLISEVNKCLISVLRTLCNLMSPCHYNWGLWPFCGFPFNSKTVLKLSLEHSCCLLSKFFSKHQNSNNLFYIHLLLSCHNAFRSHCNNCGLSGEELWVPFHIPTATAFLLLSENYIVSI